MKKVFLDFGGNRGQGLRQFAKMFNIDSSWEVKTFEPNDFCNLKEELFDFPFVDVYNQAVWIYDGTVQFNRTTAHRDGRSANDKNGNSYIDEGSSVMGLNAGDVAACVQDVIDVECVDISRLINEYSEDDFVVVKMDVEGAEFELVKKILIDNTIEKIDELYIEWHTQHVPNETYDTERDLKEKLSKTKANVHDWH